MFSVFRVSSQQLMQPKSSKVATVVQMQPLDRRDAVRQCLVPLPVSNGPALGFIDQARATLTEQLQTHRAAVADGQKRAKREAVLEAVLLGASCLGMALGVLFAVGVLGTTPVGWVIVGLAATGGLLTFAGMGVSAYQQRCLRKTGEKLAANVEKFEAEFVSLTNVLPCVLTQQG
jgi:hypothetical protein